MEDSFNSFPLGAGTRAVREALAPFRSTGCGLWNQLMSVLPPALRASLVRLGPDPNATWSPHAGRQTPSPAIISRSAIVHSSEAASSVWTARGRRRGSGALASASKKPSGGGDGFTAALGHLIPKRMTFDPPPAFRALSPRRNRAAFCSLARSGRPDEDGHPQGPRSASLGRGLVERPRMRTSAHPLQNKQSQRGRRPGASDRHSQGRLQIP